MPGGGSYINPKLRSPPLFWYFWAILFVSSKSLSLSLSTDYGELDQYKIKHEGVEIG